MRLLHLVERFDPFVGGMERAVENLAGEQAAMGYEVHVATLRLSPDHPYQEERTSDGGGSFTLHRVAHTPLRNFHPPFPDPVTVAALGRLLRRSAPFDVVHSHGLMGFSYLALRAAGLARAPVVWNLHDYGLTCAKRTRLYLEKELCDEEAFWRCLGCTSAHVGRAQGTLTVSGLFTARPLTRWVDRYIANSRTTAAAHRLKGKPLDIIPPGIVPASEFAGEPLPSWVPAAPYIMFVGALDTAKGAQVLLDAYDKLAEPKPPLLMVVSQQRRSSHREGSVHFVYSVPYRQVRAAWSHALFGVNPSMLAEPWGMATAEAMAAGKPVVATGIGATPEVLDGAGLLFPPGDGEALAEQMGKLLDDPQLREELGSRAHEVADRYSLARSAALVGRTYEAVISGADRSAEAAVISEKR